jgi:hypothetical protein
MKSKNIENQIKFYSWSQQAEELSEMPVPAKNHVSEMWKATERYYGNKDKSLDLRVPGDGGNGVPNLGLKHCIPYFDAMTAGYLQLLHCDLQVTQVNGQPEIKWRSSLPPLQVRQAQEISAPNGYSSKHYAWLMQWGLQTPDGWSCFITQPVNRPEFPFMCASGFMDTDKYHAPGNISFHVKEGFEGIIPAGTPIYQIIPIKREPWISVKDNNLRSEGRFDQERKKNVFSGFYKKNRWQKKEYS